MYKVLFFGIARDMAGVRELSFDGEGAKTLGEFKEAIIKRYPALSDLASIKMAVNSEYQIDQFELNMGDEIAIIPPVSGG